MMEDNYNYSTTDEEICVSLTDEDEPWTAEKYPGCPWGFKRVKRAKFQENEVWRFLGR
jgi:hypothetical protein